MKPLRVLSYFLAIIVAVGCQSQEFEDVYLDPSADGSKARCLKSELPLCFKYETLDESGQPTSEFLEGENIILSFEMINQGDYDISLKNTNNNFLGNPDFMSVKDASGRKTQLISGLPRTDVGYLFVPAQGSYRFQVSYYNDSSLVGQSLSEDGGFPIIPPVTEDSVPELKAGVYTSAFTSEYIFRTQNETTEHVFTVPLSLRFMIK